MGNLFYGNFKFGGILPVEYGNYQGIFALIFVIFIGFCLDFVLGDPRWIPHPVVIIGKAVSSGEKLLRQFFGRHEYLAGLILAVIIIAGTFVLSFGILYGAYSINSLFGLALEMFWAFQIFAARSLTNAAQSVKKACEEGGVEAGRLAVSMIVGRDVAYLDEKEVIKATVETVAENTVDGITAPLFYMLIGGVPLAMAYKAVNTLDSMVGYRNDKYINFGKFSAKFDDVCNFIPARITGVLMCICAGLDSDTCGKRAFKIFLRDRLNHDSPNSAHCEAAMAGALGIQLAGNASYFGKIHKKKTIGDDIFAIKSAHIKDACKLMYLTVGVTVLISIALLSIALFLII